MRFSEIIDRLNKKDARCKFELGSSKSFRINNIKGFSDWISIDLEKLNTDKEFFSNKLYRKGRTDEDRISSRKFKNPKCRL